MILSPIIFPQTTSWESTVLPLEGLDIKALSELPVAYSGAIAHPRVCYPIFSLLHHHDENHPNSHHIACNLSTLYLNSSIATAASRNGDNFR